MHRTEPKSTAFFVELCDLVADEDGEEEGIYECERGEVK
jgi:hypothetical protein